MNDSTSPPHDDPAPFRPSDRSTACVLSAMPASGARSVAGAAHPRRSAARDWLRRSVAGVAACGLSLALARPPAATPGAGYGVEIVSDGHTRIADPKLVGGGAEVSFHLTPAPSTLVAKVEAHGASGLIETVWSGTLQGGAPPTVVVWDGKNRWGRFVDTGDYELRIGAQDGSGPVLALPVSIVRLGLIEIEFQDSPGADDEWQMVYFKKGSSYGQFFAAPEIHEYSNTKKPGEVSDLDLDTAFPRPPVAPHVATDEPVMDGVNYEIEQFNYPLAYVKGATPRLEVTLGSCGTNAGGAAMSAGYPVAGYDLRIVAHFPLGVTSASGPIDPADPVTLDGSTLPGAVGRHPYDVTWTWQYAATGSGWWSDVPGALTTQHRLYTLAGAPYFAPAGTGTQYAGPWVEIAEYFAGWKETLGIDTSTDGGVVETFVKGFFGQNGGIPTAIEGVSYVGYTNYTMTAIGPPHKRVKLSALLDGAAHGPLVNCDDCMGATSTGLAMLGVANVQGMALGAMDLRAAWKIGGSSYTTLPASFSYHFVVTRTAGSSVIDTCMQLDEDGNPDAVPGTPGWNVDRPWSGSTGYEALSSSNAPLSWQLAALPGLQ